MSSSARNRRPFAAKAAFVLGLIALSSIAGMAAFGPQVLSLQRLLTPILGSAAPAADADLHANEAEHFEPVTAPTESAALAVARSGHTATRLDNGKVLVVGGAETASAEIYPAPAEGPALLAYSDANRAGHTATVLSDNRVLIAGGHGDVSTKIYDPAENSFIDGPNLTAARTNHTATLLDGDRVLFTGGDEAGTAEILDVVAQSSTVVSPLKAARKNHSAIKIGDGSVFIVGGEKPGTPEALNSAEIFDVNIGEFQTVGNTMTLARAKALLRPLPDGKVQIIGGNTDGSMEVYDSVTGVIGAYAHVRVVSATDGLCANLLGYVLTAPTRAALIHGGADAYDVRSGHTITELGATAIVIGGSASGAPSNVVTSFASSDARITTDKLDYAPGEVATITLTGFQAHEELVVKIHEDPHTTRERGLDLPEGVVPVADAQGNYTGKYTVQDYDLDLKFFVAARGKLSLRTAQTAFTDSRPQSITVGAPTSVTVAQGSTASYGTLSIGAVGNNTQCDVLLSVVAGSGTGLPASVTPVWGANPLITTGSTATTSFDVTTTSSTAVGTYTFQINGQNIQPQGGECQGTGTTNSDLLTLVVTAGTVNTTTAVSNASATFGAASISLTATVSPTSGPPVGNGSVTFTVMQGATMIGAPVTDNSVVAGVASVSYALPANQAAGAYTIEAAYTSGTGFNSSTGTGQLTIGAASQTITFGALANKTYGDADFNVSASATSGLTVSFGSETPSVCTVSGITIHIVAAGSCRVRASQAGDTNYDAAPNVDQPFTVGKATAVVVVTPYNVTYDGQPRTATVTSITGVNGETGATVGTVDVTNTTHTNAGTYSTDSWSFTGTANYNNISATTITDVIGKAEVTATAGGGSGTYNGLAQTPSDCAVTGAYTGSLACSNSPASVGPGVGTFAIAPVAVGSDLANFNVNAVNGSYTINPAIVIATAGSGSGNYNGSTQWPSDCVVSGGYTGGLSCVNSPASVGPGVGTTTINPVTSGADIGNFLVNPVAGSYTINALTITVTPNSSQSKNYGDTDPTLTYGFTPSLITGDSFSGSLARDAGENVGQYNILPGTLALSSNYSLNFVSGVKFQINKATLGVTADDQTRVYGDANPTLTYQITGFVNSETLATSGVTGTPVCSTAAVAATPIINSPVAITCAAGTLASDNYAFNFVDGDLTITPATLSVNASAGSKMYGDDDPVFSHTLTGYKNLEDATSSGVTGTANCSRTLGETVLGGPYTITCSPGAPGNLSAANYIFVTGSTATFTITPKPASVTPDATSKTYGDADPAFTGTLSGFLPADGVAAAYSRTAGETVLGGPYTISAALTPSSVLSNYSVTHNTAIFTITPKAASVTPNAAGKTYGDADPVFSGTLIGFLPGDSVVAVYSRTAGETVAGSPYTISASLSPVGVLGNYSITYNTSNFTISAKAASVTPDAKTKVYGQADPVLTGTLGGFLPADGVTATYSRTTGEDVTGSPYTISATLAPVAVLGNYDITYNTAEFDITALTVTVTPDAAQSKIYGNADPTLTYGYDPALITGDSFTGVLSRAAGETVGMYDITKGTLALSDNYNLVFIDTVDFEITKRDATWTTNANSKTYGSADPSPLTTGSGDFLAADNVTATYSRAVGETVLGGPYHITASLSSSLASALDNYNVTNVGAAFAITTKAASVTPNAASKEYGSADPALTGTLSGFLAADSVTAAYSRVSGETVTGGPYTISAVLSPAGVLTNYVITYNQADFTITQKAATWTTNPNSKIFGQGDPVPLTTGSGSGFLPADGVTATYTRVSGEAVGNYLISANLSPSTVLSNYTVTNAGANFAITAWLLNGYYQPVGIPNTYGVLQPPTVVWNTVKGGQTVPLKFNIFAGPVEQTNTAAVSLFTAQEMPCNSVPATGEDTVEITTTGGTTLRYSGIAGVDGQFIQNWQTPKAPDKCYRVIMRSLDGSYLVSFFKTKK